MNSTSTAPCMRVSQAEHEAIQRLLDTAIKHTGTGERIRHFLLAWSHPGLLSGWHPRDLWSLDEQMQLDIFTILKLIARGGGYPSDLGYRTQFERLASEARAA